MASQGTQSIDRAAELLSLVVQADDPVSYNWLVDTTGLARSTTSRLLAALERNGLLERTADGLFRSGPLFTHYASRFDRVETLTAAAQPVLERLAESTGETVNLGVPRGRTVVQIAQIDSSYIVGAANWLEVDVPPHCSALGKVLYAYGALPMPGGKLERRTDSTVVDVRRLKKELDTVRDQGYAVTVGELEEGLNAVAAPVFGHDDIVHASLGVSGPSFRMEGDLGDLGRELIGEAERLRKALARSSYVAPTA